jgi:hypothetical protein
LSVALRRLSIAAWSRGLAIATWSWGLSVTLRLTVALRRLTIALRRLTVATRGLRLAISSWGLRLAVSHRLSVATGSHGGRRLAVSSGRLTIATWSLRLLRLLGLLGMRLANLSHELLLLKVSAVLVVVDVLLVSQKDLVQLHVELSTLVE